MCKDTKYLIILLLLFILTIPNTHAAKNITYTFRKLDDTRPLLPGFHNQMKKIARGVLKGIPTGMTRVAVFSYKTMNYNPTTNVSRALQIVDYLDIISPNGDMDSEAMNDAIEITSNYFQGVLFFSLFGLIPLLIVIVWIILYWIYGCCRCCFMCCGKSKLVKESKLMQKYYARGDVQSYLKKLKKREGAQCICRAISGLFIFTFVILIIVWIIFAEQTSIEASMIVADGISAVETLENYVEGGFDIANDVIQFTDAFDRIVDKANETFLSKIPNVQKIDSWMQCIDGIVESLPNTTNIKDFLSGVNETVNGLQLNDLIGLIEELEDIVHGVKFKDLQSLYDEVKKVKDVILEIPTSLEDINASFTEMNEQKNSLPNMEDLENSLEEIETKLNDLENLDQFIVKLKNFTGHKPKEIANDLMNISATIQDLKESIPGLVESFNQIELVKNSFPSFDNIQEQINGINQTIESINFDSLMEPIKNLSNSMDMVFDVRDRVSITINRHS
jgi:methyl-accepting chemotaxis protein